MGRRGQREREKSSVSFDALPALWGSRCVGTGMSGRGIPANKVVPQKMYFLSLFPLREQGHFYLEVILWNVPNGDGAIELNNIQYIHVIANRRARRCGNPLEI